MTEPEVAPPPAYDDVVRLPRDTPSLSSSDPLLGRRERTDTGSLSSGGRRSQQYLPGRRDGVRSSQTYISDSPHSSDDEETAMLKSELRRLREQKTGQDNETKKMLLRQVLEEERRAAAAAESGSYNTVTQWQPPQAPQYSYPGAIIHPVATNVPGQTTSGATGYQPYAAPLQCPSTSGQGPSTSTAVLETPTMQTGTEGDEGDNRLCCAIIFILIFFVSMAIVFYFAYRSHV